MILTLIASTVALLITGIFLRWFQIKNYWKNKRVPHLTPHPILGSMTILLKKNPALWMREMYDHFRSPYVGVWLFWRPALIINSPEIARRVLVKDAAIFRDRFLSSGSALVGVTKSFTASKLRQSYRHVAIKSKELVDRIKVETEKHGRINLRKIFSDYTTDVVGTTSFGVASDATITGEGPLRTVTKDFMKFSIFRGLCWASIFFYPELVDIFGFTFFPKTTTDFFRKVYNEIIAQRGGYEVEVTEARDMIDALRKIKQDFKKDQKGYPKEVLIITASIFLVSVGLVAERELRLVRFNRMVIEVDKTRIKRNLMEINISEDTLIAQAAIFLQGGFDTTSAVLSFCIYELAFHPDIQERLHEELIETKQKNQDKDFEYSDLNELTYLNCIMKETLRKYGPMGWLDRVASKDYQIDEHLLIKRGTPVYVNAIGMQYDPDFFPEPLKFNPDRFLPCNDKNIKPFTYVYAVR